MGMEYNEPLGLHRGGGHIGPTTHLHFSAVKGLALPEDHGTHWEESGIGLGNQGHHFMEQVAICI